MYTGGCAGGNGCGADETGIKDNFCLNGGVASGESKRRKKTISELAASMLNSTLSEPAKKGVKKLVPDTEDNDLTVAAAMVAGQIQAAIDGVALRIDEVPVLAYAHFGIAQGGFPVEKTPLPTSPKGRCANKAL